MSDVCIALPNQSSSLQSKIEREFKERFKDILKEVYDLSFVYNQKYEVSSVMLLKSTTQNTKALSGI